MHALKDHDMKMKRAPSGRHGNTKLPTITELQLKILQGGLKMEIFYMEVQINTR